jgi:hypothetical protein
MELKPQDSKNHDETSETSGKEHSPVSRIVWFYENNDFEEFYPRKD